MAPAAAVVPAGVGGGGVGVAVVDMPQFYCRLVELASAPRWIRVVRTEDR
jgi:hypothetical protein